MCRNCQNLIKTLEGMKQKREFSEILGKDSTIFSLNTQISPKNGQPSHKKDTKPA